jgi:lipoprotein-releasing system permease protein
VPFELFVAVRFLREGRMQTLLILVGVAFGVGVMVFLHALISGLQQTLIKQTLGSQAHVIVRPREQQPRPLSRETAASIASRIEKASQRTPAMDQWQPLLAQLAAVPGVLAVAPTVAGSAFATKGNVSKSVALRGVEPDSYVRIIDIGEKLSSGEFRVSGPEAVIGAELAKDLGLSVGDKLRLVTAEGRSEVFAIKGIFDLGNKDVNQRWVFVSLRAAQTMLDLVGSISTVEARVREVFEAEAVAQEITLRTGQPADSWMKLNQQLLIGLRSQNSSSYMIQFFVMVAVTLGIASVLVVSVVQKSREIGILKATGTSTARITRIFFIQGGIVGLVGSALGSGIGTALSMVFSSLARNPDGSPTFPVDLNAQLFATAMTVATLTGLLAAVAPARRAALLDPATVIRHG